MALSVRHKAEGSILFRSFIRGAVRAFDGTNRSRVANENLRILQSFIVGLGPLFLDRDTYSVTLWGQATATQCQGAEGEGR